MIKAAQDDVDLSEVYEPAEDTYLLLKAAIGEIQPDDSVLEIGCGRCVISEEISPRVKSLISTDINPHAVRLAGIKGLKTIRADIFKGIKAKFDLILFNPPYLPTSDKERSSGWLNLALDGGPCGRDVINGFLEELGDHLAPGGRALILVSSLTGLKDVEEKARLEEFDARIIAQERYFFESLYVLKLTFANVRYQQAGNALAN